MQMSDMLNNSAESTSDKANVSNQGQTIQPIDVGDKTTQAGGDPTSFNADEDHTYGLTPDNAQPLGAAATWFPPGGQYKGSPFSAYRWKAGHNGPLLLYNAFRDQNGISMPYSDRSYFAMLAQEDFGVSRPKSRDHWYCIFAGAKQNDFKLNHSYKVPLDVQSWWRWSNTLGWYKTRSLRTEPNQPICYDLGAGTGGYYQQ